MIVGGFFLSVDSSIYVVAVVDKGEERKFGSGRKENERRKEGKKGRRNGRMERDWILYHYYLLLLLLYTVADTTVYLLLATYYYYNYLYFAYTGHQMGYGTCIIYSTRWSSSSIS